MRSLPEKQKDEVTGKLNQAETQARGDALSFAQMTSNYQKLNTTYSALETELTNEEAQVKQRSAGLELARRSLNEEIAAKDSLQGQLAEVYERLEKSADEVARLEKFAVTAPERLPISEKEVNGNEAKEIPGSTRLAHCRRIRCR